MKKLITAMLVVISLASLAACTKDSKDAFANEKSAEAMEQIIIYLLADATADAVDDYYGENRQYWNVNLLRVQRLPDTEYPKLYEAVLQVETFYGPHNPPYGIETITLHIRYDGIESVGFEHQDA